MSLPLPQLDDKTFAQLMEEARKLIPRYAPQWTDYNTHDPGITFLELFAWLTELQRYYLDQIRDENFVKFLKLLGIRLKDASSATTDVTFSFVDEDTLVPVLLPQGTKLATKEQVVFETDTSLLVIPARLEKIIRSSFTGRKDYIDVNRQDGLSFLAFGDNAEAGSYLYLGFNLLYIFDWDQVHTNQDNEDSARLKQYLEHYFGLTWVRDVDCGDIRKINDTTITVTDGEHFLTLKLHQADNRVALTFEPDTTNPNYFLFSKENPHFICGQPFPANQVIILTFNLFENYPIARGNSGDETVNYIPSATLVWEYYSSEGEGQWKRLQLVEDSTKMLSQSGRLWFTAPNDMGVRNIFPYNERLYWLRVKVEEEGYELPPKINTILLNTISVTQKNTLSEVRTFSSDGESTQSLPATYLALRGDNILQVRQFDLTLLEVSWRAYQQKIPFILWIVIILNRIEEFNTQDGYWKDWEDTNLEKNETEGIITLTFSDKIPLKDKDNLRLISYLVDVNNPLSLGSGNGLPNQTLSLKNFPVIAKNFQIQIKQNHEIWQDWIRVDDLDNSQPEQKHYILEANQGQIYFGDGVNGEIPQAIKSQNEANIRIISCQTIEGEKGNVEAKAIHEILNPLYTLSTGRRNSLQRNLIRGIKVENPEAASGGAAQETLERAKLRARKQLKQINRTVTFEDIELLACSTPGLRVARAKVIAPSLQEPKSLIKIIVVPYSETPKPTKPSKGFLQTIAQHIEKHRLITTQIQIIPPTYVEVSVKAIVLIKPTFNPKETREKIENYLTQRFLHPLNGGSENKGWTFGRAVYKSEIYKAIENSTPGVDCVEKIELIIKNADPNANPHFKNEDIHISQQTLIYSTEHTIQIKT